MMAADTNCEMGRGDATDADLERILRTSRTIAVVGLSSSEDRPSNQVARYLKDAGYRIIPVNPGQAEILGEKCYPSLDAVPVPVDVADLFLRPDNVPPAVDAAIRKGVKVVWMQIGISNAAAAAKAKEACIEVVMNRCLKIEHTRLIPGAPR